MSPDVACLCVDLGIWSALTIAGPSRERMIEGFRADHQGDGHVPDESGRDWYGEEAALRKHLRKLRVAA